MDRFHCSGIVPMPMTHDERAFFKALGARIAQLRNDQGLTQAELGEQVGETQQQIASFEVGRRRVPVSLLPELAQALGVSIETLVGKEPKPGKRGPSPKLQQQLERLGRLPKSQQQIVSKMLDAVLKETGSG